MCLERDRGGGTERPSKEVGGREVAEDKGQGHPSRMVLMDLHTGSGVPLSANWFQFRVPVEEGGGSRAPLPIFFQETILGQLTDTEPLSERCPGLCYSLSVPSHHHPLSFQLSLLQSGAASSSIPYFIPSNQYSSNGRVLKF